MLYPKLFRENDFVTMTHTIDVNVGTDHQENALRTKLLTDAGAGCLKTRAPLHRHLCWIEDLASPITVAETAESKHVAPPALPLVAAGLASAPSFDDVTNLTSVGGGGGTGGDSAGKRNREGFSPSTAMDNEFQRMSLATEPSTVEQTPPVRENPDIYKAPISDLLR